MVPAPHCADDVAGRAVNWFDAGCTSEYLAVYPHRDRTDARSMANLIRSSVTCEAGSPALDVGCGVGRHRPFLSRFQWTVGIDLSAPLLGIARARDQDSVLVRADMRRLPFRSRSFALVVNLFTSFGYFDDDREHRRVIAEIARVTRPGGWFILDFLNARRVRTTLVPFDSRCVGGRVLEQTRDISSDGRYVRKAIRFADSGNVFRERVRLFEPADLVSMLTDCGFVVVDAFGDYRRNPITAESPRNILVSRLRLGSIHH